MLLNLSMISVVSMEITKFMLNMQIIEKEANR